MSLSTKDGGRLVRQDLEPVLTELFTKSFPFFSMKPRHEGRWPYGTLIRHKAGVEVIYVGRTDRYTHSVIRAGGGIFPAGTEEDIDDVTIELWSEIDE